MADQTGLVIVVSLLTTLVIQAFIGFLNQQESKRKERHQYLVEMIKLLADVRGEIQWCQVAFYDALRLDIMYMDEPDQSIEFAISPELRLQAFERLQLALGKAHAILVAVDDPELSQLGMDIMKSNRQPYEQNKLLERALKRLGERARIIEANDAQRHSES